jgi:hypothetical protein
MSNNKPDKDDIQFMTDLLMDSHFSLSEIAKELNWSINYLNKQINRYGLSWVKQKKKKMSRGHSSLYDILKKLIPNEEIINEYHIGNRLKLDIYCPKYKIAIEYHGRQHFYYTSRFHASKADFIESQKRDQLKSQMCSDNGISLLVFRYDDGLTEKNVFERIIQELRNSGFKDKMASKKSNNKLTNNAFYQKAKKENSIRRKKIYRELKRKNSEPRRNHK